MSGTGGYHGARCVVSLSSGSQGLWMADLLKDPAHWRDRAEEARRLAEALGDPKARQTMLEIAESYDRLAGRALVRTTRRP
jgi:hypothetical protein